MPVVLSEILTTLNDLAPLELAGGWDNVGLLVEPIGGDQSIERHRP